MSTVHTNLPSAALQRLISAFQAVLHEEDGDFMKNMRSSNLHNDDITRYRYWEWTQGVGLYGLWKLYESTGDDTVLKTLVQFYDERIRHGLPGKNINTTAPMLALSFLYEKTGEAAYGALVTEWAEFLLNGLPKTEEGGFQHVTSDSFNKDELWDDTLYMAVLFLANAGRLMGRLDWLEEAEYQFLLHARYLCDWKDGLWYHGWTFEGRHHFAGAYWGRGNAWVAAAIPEYLRIVSPAASVRRALVEVFRQQARALIACQDDEGMWHTLLDDPTSYQEASATSGIAYGLLAGVSQGLLPEQYRSHALRALPAVIGLIDEGGVVQQVSYGTPMGRDSLDFYKQIRITPMPYGQAMAMLFLIEAMRAGDALDTTENNAV